MIIDRIQLSGLDAYFQDPNNPGLINLGTDVGPVVRLYPLPILTKPLNKGKQLEISGLQLLIEGDDLSPLFQFAPSPLIQISVMKEMFTGLFADPFRHRVHNIAGYLDFSEGIITNGKVMEIEGIPTIVSTGKDECKWVSREYILPDLITVDSVAWKLATSKLTPPDSFTYKIDVECKDAGGGVVDTINLGADFIRADTPRFQKKDVPNVKSFQITFRAMVNLDSFVMERQLPGFNEKTGRPLLRAINILESLDSSVYDIHSLTELLSLCSDSHLFESSGSETGWVAKLLTGGPSINRLTATLDLSAVLVNSPNEKYLTNTGRIYFPDSNPPTVIPGTEYEFIELKILTDQFTRFEAKRIGVELIRQTI